MTRCIEATAGGPVAVYGVLFESSHAPLAPAKCLLTCRYVLISGFFCCADKSNYVKFMFTGAVPRRHSEGFVSPV